MAEATLFIDSQDRSLQISLHNRLMISTSMYLSRGLFSISKTLSHSEPVKGTVSIPKALSHSVPVKGILFPYSIH